MARIASLATITPRHQTAPISHRRGLFVFSPEPIPEAFATRYDQPRVRILVDAIDAW